MVSVAVCAVRIFCFTSIYFVVPFPTPSAFLFPFALHGFVSKSLAFVTLFDVQVRRVSLYFEQLAVDKEATYDNFVGYIGIFGEDNHRFVGRRLGVVSSQWRDFRNLEISVHIVLFFPLPD